MKHVPEGVTKQDVHDHMKPLFDEADTSGDGLVDMDELRAAMKAHGPKGLADKKKKKAAKELAKIQKGPTPADIIEACDADGSGGISKDEAHACIDAHISDESDNEMAHEAVDEGFDYVDKDGSGEVDEHELSASKKALKAMVDHCDQADADGSFDGGLSIDEVCQC